MTHFAERHYRSLIFAIWLTTSLLMYHVGRDFIAAWKMGDPDDQLRLVQVRDWLAGQSWWDVTQYRMNTPNGGPMHWSRLVDVPIAATIVLLGPLLGPSNSEYVAAIIVPLFTCGIVLTLYAAITRRLFDSATAVVAALLMILIWPVRAQLLPLRIDHHGWQIVMFLVAALGLLNGKRPLVSAVWIGVASALWIEISVEGLPFAALFLGLLAIEWLKAKPDDNANRWRFPVALAALAAGTIFFYFITETWREKANHCDSLSPFHVATFVTMAAVLAAGTYGLRHVLTNRMLGAKFAIGMAALAAGVASWSWFAPECFGDAFGTLDPLVRKYWYVRVYEGLPFWRAPREDVIAPILALAIGLFLLTLWFLRGKKTRSNDGWLLVLLTVGSAIAGVLVIRTIVYVLLLSGIFVAWGIVELFRQAERRQGLIPRMGLRVAAVVLAMNYLFAQNLSDRLSRNESPAGARARAADLRFETTVRACQSYKASVELNALPPSQLMGALDSSPSILQFTRHHVVATGHHRNDQAMADVIRTFVSDADVAKQILRKRKIDYVVSCPGSFELRLYAQQAPAGFGAMLRRGETPSWLVRQSDIGPFQIWRTDWTRS